MTWVLIVYLATSYGVTESQSDFDTLEQCQEAQLWLHEKWEERSDLVVLRTECRYD